ncbi:MAG: SIS domain-containing protein [Chloroherpetonaceae bacterium]|nr:SIS domain-containing protein [Chthonomonadaceae bacterium]MDW8206282.1 SIS domain-containing protein [Chloroherpetonaceae bacterium]
MQQTHHYLRTYLDDLKQLLDQIDPAQVESLVDALLTVWRNGGRALLMGNGGSSSSVSHIVNDLQKNLQLETGRPLRALCLSDSTPLMMAWANDTRWDNIFAPQVECWAEPGDLVIGVSGSGNSSNVINGILAANQRRARTFGLAGFSGGRLKEVAQQCIVVPSESMQRIEDVHMVILHAAFCAFLERARQEARQGEP